MSGVECTDRMSRRDDARILESRMRITAMQDGRLRLQGERTASCASCTVKSGCGIKGMSDLIYQSPQQLSAPTPARMLRKPEVGDEVVVSISGDEFLQLTMLAYLLPAAALAATACLSQLVGFGDAETAILSLIAFAVSFLPLRWREQAGSGLTTLAIEQLRQTGSEGYKAARPQTEAPENGNQK